MNDLEIATDLRAAADYLRTRGWNQGGMGEDGNPRCVAGAIYSAIGADWFIEKPYLNECAISAHLAALGFNPRVVYAIGDTTTISRWNDYVDDIEDILDRLESTALALEVRVLATERVPEAVHV